jgi:hypothetical protein
MLEHLGFRCSLVCVAKIDMQVDERQCDGLVLNNIQEEDLCNGWLDLVRPIVISIRKVVSFCRYFT